MDSRISEVQNNKIITITNINTKKRRLAPNDTLQPNNMRETSRHLYYYCPKQVGNS